MANATGKTCSMLQFIVEGPELPKGEAFLPFITEPLNKRKFVSIDDTADEISKGWVKIFDRQNSDFAVPGDFWFGDYLAFSLRTDRRKVPASVVRGRVDEEKKKIMKEQNLKRIPRAMAAEIKERVVKALLAKTVPVPSFCDIVWDTTNHVVTIYTSSIKGAEAAAEGFTQTFHGYKLKLIHPYARCLRVSSAKHLDLLQGKNKSATENVLDNLTANAWVGPDFFAWLFTRTLDGVTEYEVLTPGIATQGESFIAYLDHKIVLCGESDAGKQKVAISGPQDRYREAVAGRESGKVVLEAVIVIEQKEESWRFTLRGSDFGVSGFKGPASLMDGDDEGDRGGDFLDMMAVREKGLQLFDSILASFIASME